MTKDFLAAMAVAALVFCACGGDDDDGIPITSMGSGGSGPSSGGLTGGSSGASSDAGVRGPCVTSLPSGSYARSCQGCTMTGTVLACLGCNDGKGASPRARLDTCSCGTADRSQSISNQNGVLTCGTIAPPSGGKCSMKVGECKSAADCTCGASCGVVAVCTACTKRCNFYCETNEDCVRLTSNLEVPRRTCTMTSSTGIKVCQ